MLSVAFPTALARALTATPRSQQAPMVGISSPLPPTPNEHSGASQSRHRTTARPPILPLPRKSRRRPAPCFLHESVPATFSTFLLLAQETVSGNSPTEPPRSCGAVRGPPSSADQRLPRMAAISRSPHGKAEALSYTSCRPTA